MLLHGVIEFPVEQLSELECNKAVLPLCEHIDLASIESRHPSVRTYRIAGGRDIPECINMNDVKMEVLMKPMSTFLLRLPESLMTEVAEVSESQFCTKSAFIRQSLQRNISLTRDVEMPLLRQYHTETTLRMLRVAESIQKDRKDTP